MLILLAEEVNIQTVVSYVIGGIAGGGGLLVIARWLIGGFWVDKVKPIIKSEIASYLGTQEEKTRRENEIKDTVRLFELDPTNVSKRENTIKTFVVSHESQPDHRENERKFIKETIDNEIKRTDGLIYNEVTKRVSEIEKSIDGKLNRLTELVEEEIKLRQQTDTKLTEIKTILKTGGGRYSYQDPNDSFSNLKPGEKTRG